MCRESEDVETGGIAMPGIDLSSGLSWSGFNICGDHKSIKEVKRLVETVQYLDSCVKDLLNRLQ